ncbi:MAG: glutaminyl-tRNA synthase (glutamine-hydrolyzing) subunit A [Bdellovibrionales bacterium GWB1_52_6]|nr:MAG: glutaminyl-tRNA synthase (glutamine-hydrolyzing) subunit A [Bdellovibrionales bacterium GWB1_52_6]OFZ06419.1 MAG: glutaminyl-tRNA synthase (glutamine-hydrolyzing) subunit A [Bdellovibrionales bacterium GWA1_52_35]HCM40178.1 Asp-tRNA(Asn)/Glu-tRNA(Gln) amidotransferase GatCAB subunit A [Bdellovibrionales bacterium]
MIQSIREIHDSFDRGEKKPSALVAEYLARIQASPLNAYITVCADRALRQAIRADEVLLKAGKVPRSGQPLFGIPVGIKDNLALSGVRMTCASKVLENYIPPYSATAVERVEAAGAITLGKLNMDEFAMGGSNENSAFGPVLHPTHPDRVPGGSSGGAAAAVRANLCVVALGSDTGGSVRLPASYCGVVGLKPTYGRISRYGLVAFASSLDQVGPIAANVEDTEVLFNVLAGHDSRDSTSLLSEVTAPAAPFSIAGLRIGVPAEYFVEGVASEIRTAIHFKLQLLESQGARLVPLHLAHSRYAVATYYLLAVSEASSNLSRFDGVRYGVRPQAAVEAGELGAFYRATRARFGAEVKRRIILGTFALSSGYVDAYYHRASQVRKLIQRDFAQAFSEVDVIASPVAPATAYKLGERSDDPLQMYLNDIFTVPANLAGFPAISLPSGEDAAGLPIGLQFMAAHSNETLLFGLARQLEQSLKEERS